MRVKQLAFYVLAVLLVTALSTTIVRSEDKPADKAGAAAMPTPEQMMAIMAKYGTPGPEHAKLKTMEGAFDADVTMQMMPDAPPQTSKGKMKNTMILDGRYLMGEYEGEMMGQPFKGLVISGYDRYAKKYTSTWVDSMSTLAMNSEGTADDAGKITLKCTFDCPITQGKRTSKEVLTINSPDSHTMEMFDTGPDGKEFKSMTIKYTRAK
jgi:hypothetical protein